MATQDFGVLLTPAGQAAIANATALNRTVNIKYIVVGDGGGSEYRPTEGQTELKNIVYEMQIADASVDSENPNWIVVEGYIPEDVGGWTIREIGVRDDQRVTLAIGNTPTMFKPVMAQGAAQGTYIKIIMPVENASVINITVDPAIVLATRQWVNQHILATNVHGATYVPTPLRIAIRNADGRVQVEDGVESKDAINMQQMEQVIALIGSVSDSGVPLAWTGLGNGAGTEYGLLGLVSNNPATLFVELDGVTQTWGIDYTISLTPQPRVVFTDPPPNGVRINIRTIARGGQPNPVNPPLFYDELEVLNIDWDLDPTPDTIPLRGPNGEIKAGPPLTDGDVVTRGSNYDYRGAFPTPPGQSVELSMPASGGTVTSPGDGWICLSSDVMANGWIVLRNGSIQTSQTTPAALSIYIYVPVAKGKSVSVHYLSASNNHLVFTPAIGGS